MEETHTADESQSDSSAAATTFDTATPDSSLSVAGKMISQPVAPDLFYSRIFAVTATALLGLALYRVTAPFIGPLVWALFISFLLRPLHVRLTRQLRGRENLSAALLTVGTFILLIGPLTAMSAAFVSQAIDLVQWVQDTLAKQTRQQLISLPIFGPALHWMRDTFGIRTGQIQSWISQGTQNLPPFLAGLGGKIFLGAINTVFAFVIMLFMLFFFVRDSEKIVGIMRDLIPMTPTRREQLMDHVAAVTRAVVFGTGMTALIQGAVVSIAFLITDLGSPLVFGVLAALLALLPIGGTALVWIPAALLLAGHQRWGMMVVMLAFGVLSSSIDNILRPLLISGRAEVSTLTVFIGVLGGASAFGPIGIFLGPVLLALIIALIRFSIELRRVA
jgi:predicted PurR-regulated permease PerM